LRRLERGEGGEMRVAISGDREERGREPSLRNREGERRWSGSKGRVGL
jgi:hypothetical protein